MIDFSDHILVGLQQLPDVETMSMRDLLTMDSVEAEQNARLFSSVIEKVLNNKEPRYEAGTNCFRRQESHG